MYASLYSCDRDLQVLRAFYKAWFPETNILHTILGEISITLWELCRLGGLSINGRIYDEAIPNQDALYQHCQSNHRLIQPACRYLFATYNQLKNVNDKGVSKA